MPKKLRRPLQPGTVYHFIVRFVANEWFIRGEEERRSYLAHFGRAIASSDWRCCAFAIMSNHIHAALVAGRDALAGWCRQAHSPFGIWINERRERIGAVFTRGPQVHAVPETRVASLIAYIHNNPVRAGVVTAARAATWTSHPAYVGRAARPAWLDVRLGLARAEFTSVDAFDAWVHAMPGERLAPDGSVRGEDVVARVIQITCAELRVDSLQVGGEASPVAVLARLVVVHAAVELRVRGAVIAAVLELSASVVCRLRQNDDEIVRKVAERVARTYADEARTRAADARRAAIAEAERWSEDRRKRAIAA